MGRVTQIKGIWEWFVWIWVHAVMSNESGYTVKVY